MLGRSNIAACLKRKREVFEIHTGIIHTYIHTEYTYRYNTGTGEAAPQVLSPVLGPSPQEGCCNMIRGQQQSL